MVGKYDPLSVSHFCPKDIKVGDFMQTTSHFGDVFFEVVGVDYPDDGSGYWNIDYIKYGKTGTVPIKDWVNSAGSIRRFYTAEMAVPTMIFKNQRFYSLLGKYDPFVGFVNVNKEECI